MVNWRERYHKNFSIGIAISLAVHLTLVLILLIFPLQIDEPTYYYYDILHSKINYNQYRQSGYWGGAVLPAMERKEPEKIILHQKH